MKNLIYALTITLALGPTVFAPQVFAADNSRQIDRLEEKVEDAKKEIAEKDKERARLAKERAAAKIEMEEARAALDVVARTHKPSAAKPCPKNKPDCKKGGGWGDSADDEDYRNASERAQRAEARYNAADDAYNEVYGAIKGLKAEVDRLGRRIDDLDRPVVVDCPDGNCYGKREAPNSGKSGGEVFADILKAATPLGLGAMGTFLGYQGMKQNSSDYRFYANNMTAQGLPFAAPTNNYGGIFGAALGPAFAASLAMNGFGGFGGNLYGGPFGGGIGLGLGGLGGLGGIGGFAIGSAFGGGIPFSMGMGAFSPIAIGGGIGSIFSPYSAGMMGGYAPFAMGGGLGTAFSPYAMGMGGYMPMAIGGGFAIGSAFAPYAAGGGIPYSMGMMGGYAPYAAGGGFAIGSAFAPYAAGGGFAPYAVGGGFAPYAAGGGFAIGGGFAPYAAGGGIPYSAGMMGGYAPYAPYSPVGGGIAVGGAFAPYAVGSIGGGYIPYSTSFGSPMTPYGVPYAGGGFASPGLPGYNQPGFPGGYGGYPGGIGGYPMVGGYPGGVGIPNPYANPAYGMNNSCYGGMCSYNPYLSTLNGQYGAGGMGAFNNYQATQAQAQMRMAQQQMNASQDAQNASLALQSAQQRYSQAIGNMSGSYYAGGYPSYGGAGYYSPIYSGAALPIGGIPVGANFGQPPLNATRQ